MTNPSLFSNADYYRNNVFQYLMTNFNRCIDYDGDAPKEVIDKWSDDIQKDFLRLANQWRIQNKNKTAWRRDLR